MTSLMFEVESVFQLEGRAQAYVLARQLIPSSWQLPSSSVLAGVHIREWTDVPRSQDENGVQREDLFGFCLCSASDISKFFVGQTVELEP